MGAFSLEFWQSLLRAPAKLLHSRARIEAFTAALMVAVATAKLETVTCSFIIAWFLWGIPVLKGGKEESLCSVTFLSTEAPFEKLQTPQMMASSQAQTCPRV
mmetsp:Transcript_12401/g.24107  ORF Transcript_12401/g.24107 Transcript_12401/m.24107 type:complete len:102 (-) Transcript_12401:84-389(-)